MTEITPHQLLQYGLRHDLNTFVHRCFQTVVPGESFSPNWHVEAMCYALERVRLGELKRLIITVPPRSLKSICASVAFPAFLLGHDPTSKIICASYAEGLSTKHANDCRAVMKSDWYRQIFPNTRIHPNRDSQTETVTTRLGFRLSTSIGGVITGRGGDTMIIDDVMKPQDAMSELAREAVRQWYSNTFVSRLDNKETGAIIVVMQRLHVDDLVGHLLEQGGWEVLNLPAIAEHDEVIQTRRNRVYRRRTGEVIHPSRESVIWFEQQKRIMNPLDFAAQYQQAPIAASGNTIRREWLQYYNQAPTRQGDDIMLVSWDTATKPVETADYSVGTVWLVRGEQHFLLDLVRDRLDFPALRERAVALHARWQPHMNLIEDKGSGSSLIQEFRRAGLPAAPYEPKLDKELRMHAQSVRFQSGAVLLPQSAAWLGDLIAELLAFPRGRHDDQVDSISQALDWAEQWRQRPRHRIWRA